MNDSDKQQAVQELIVNTYENMGLTVLGINPFAPGVFRIEIVNEVGVHEAYVTVLLHMTQNNVDKR